MITAEKLISIFKSVDFGRDLTELSSYAASIRQERPIVQLFAKYLWRDGSHIHALESKYNRPNGERSKDKCDLSVDGKTIEFKSHFDSDMRTVGKDLKSCDNDLQEMWRRISVEKKNKTWGVCPSIYEDVLIKQPDFFVWIICSRDIKELTDNAGTSIAVFDEHQRYRRDVPYDPNGEYLSEALKVLNKMNATRPFEFRRSTVLTKGLFDSAYHLLLCEFENSFVQEAFPKGK